MRGLARILADELERREETGNLAVETSEPALGEVARLALWFAAAPRAAPAARRALESLGDHLDAEHQYKLNLLVTELVTNECVMAAQERSAR